MISLVYVPDVFVEQILNQMTLARICMKVTERINGDVICLAKEMKVGYKMFVSGSKTTVIQFRDKMVALNETTDLYGTLMILTKST